jgi:hypothetical protein
MKERLLTLGLACGALALFYLLFFPKPTPDHEKITLPLSGEHGPNGYAAMLSWLRMEKIPVVSFRERYNRLPGSVNGNGHLLLTTLPHKLGLRAAELPTLKDWLREGNTLLVMAALADTPEWAIQSALERDMVQQLNELTGLHFRPASEDTEDDETVEEGADSDQSTSSAASDIADAMQKLLEPQQHSMVPIGDHPLTTGVRSVAALSEFPASDWIATPDESAVVIELARDPTSTLSPREPVLWLAQIGAGQIIVSGFASPFTNKLLGKDDNARLLSNVVRWSLGSTGTVIIDDAHQGAVAFYDPAAFFGDPRLHRTLVWLLVLWLVFVLGPSRLRPALSRWNPVDITSFVRATGGFLARTVKPTEAGRRALMLFFNTIRHRLGLPEDGMPVWEWLAIQPHVTPQELSQLREYHARIAAGRRIDLPKLHNLLHRLTGSFV